MTPVRMKSCAGILLLTLLAACGGSADARRDKFLVRGRELLKKREYPRAILEFKNAAQAKPKDPEPYYEMGAAFSGMRDFGDAVKAYQKALQLNPKHFQAQLRLAQIFALTDDVQSLTEAQKQLKILLEGSDGTPEVLSTLAFTEMKLGHPDLAMQGFEKALAMAPDALNASYLLSSAKLLQNDVKGAEEVLQRACASAPKSGEARRLLAEFYLGQGRPAEAEPHLRRTLEMEPKNGTALMDLARLLLSAGRKQEAESSFRQLAATFDYRAFYGVFLFEEGRREEAIREFERVAKEYPEDRTSRTRLVAGYRLVNRPADADRVLQSALKKNPKDLQAMLQWSEILIEKGKYAEAEGYLNRAVKVNRTVPEVHYVLAKLHQVRGAALIYRQELAEALRLNPALEAVRLELARDYIGANDNHSARDLLNSAPESQRGSVPLLVELNWAQWALRDLAAMRQGIDRGLAQVRSPDFLIQDGLWRLDSGDSAGARKSIEEALKLDPADVRALKILNRTYLAEKNTEMAVKKVKEYAAQQPQSAPVQDFLGTILMGSGEAKQAKQAFAGALAADPKFVQSDLSLVQIDVLDGKIEEARKRLTDVVSKNQTNVTARRWLGNIEVMRGDQGAAIEHFRQVVIADPADPQALNNLAYLLVEYRNQPDEALKYAQKAVELAPQRPAYCDTLGWALYRKGLYSSAVKYLERANAGKDTTVKYHLAMAYAKAGDLAHGKTTLAAALKANPNAPEAKLAQQVLAEAH